MKKLLLLLLVLSAPIFVRAESESHIRSRMIAEANSVKAGQPFLVAIHLKMLDGWHTYWQNAGDSGLATKITWTLPAGFKAGPIQWPVPERISEDPLTSYGYLKDTYLLTEITPPRTLSAGPVLIKAKVDWLECKEICVPGKSELDISLPVGDGMQSGDPELTKLFAHAKAQLPLQQSEWSFTAVQDDNRIAIKINPPSWQKTKLKSVTFFPYEAGLIENSAPQSLSSDGKTLIIPKEAASDTKFSRLTGILVTSSGWRGPNSETSVLIEVPLPSGSISAAAEPQKTSDPTMGFGLALLFSFLGGILLNLMPCVLPVLTIKILGFVKQGGESRQKSLNHAILYTGGVLLSFLTLAGLLLFLKAGGQQLGWGFQLQSPAFVIFLCCLFFVMSLNLLGVFEFGTSFIRLGGLASQSSGYTASFMSGVLATIVATPCTGPFMGSALGYALVQTAPRAILIFMFLGLGMASPYVLLAAFPALLRFVPKPGEWMETFKKIMGFLFLATILWLLWVLGQQANATTLLFVLTGFLIISMGLAIYGKWGGFVSSLRARRLSFAFGVIFLIGGLYVALKGSSGTGSETTEGQIKWEPFTEERVIELRKEGKPVFIDFTAAWCLTCQVNKRTALSSEKVVSRFEELGIVPLEADWTSKDEKITRALASYGRNGVPLYIYYAPGAKEPQILPAVLTPGIILDYLK